MPSLLDSIKSSFESAGWKYHQVDGRTDVVECQFDAHHCRVLLHVQCYESMGALSVVAQPSVTVNDDRYGKASELLMRANMELNFGNLELDWKSGKVYFRASNVFPDPIKLGEVPRSLVHTAIAEADRIAPRITVLNRDASPAAILTDVEELLKRDDLLPPVPDQPLE